MWVCASIFLIEISLSQSHFQLTDRRWLFEDHHETCDGSHHCHRKDKSDCDYELVPLRDDNFGARITGLKLGSLTQSCADKLIQEAMMYRYLIIPRTQCTAMSNDNVDKT